MTCVVGMIEKSGKVHIAADSIGISGWNRINRVDKKLFKKGEFIFGFTESFRLIQVIEHKFKPPQRSAKQPLFAYLCSSFVDELRKCLEDAGYKSEVKDQKYPVFLLGTEGRLFHIMQDLSVGERAEPFDAVGGGSDIALGSLFSTVGQKPEKRLELALQAAAHFNMGVAPPFHFIST